MEKLTLFLAAYFVFLMILLYLMFNDLKNIGLVFGLWILHLTLDTIRPNKGFVLAFFAIAVLLVTSKEPLTKLLEYTASRVLALVIPAVSVVLVWSYAISVEDIVGTVEWMVQGLIQGLFTILRHRVPRAAGNDVNANGPPPPPPHGRRLAGFPTRLVWALIIGVFVGLGIPVFFPSISDVLKSFPGMSSLARQEIFVAPFADTPPGGAGAGVPSSGNRTCDAAHSTMPYSLGLIVLALSVVALVNLAPRDEEHAENILLGVEDPPADDIRPALNLAPRVEEPEEELEGDEHAENILLGVEDAPSDDIRPDPVPVREIELTGIVVEHPPLAPVPPAPHLVAADQQVDASQELHAIELTGLLVEDPHIDPARPAPRPRAGRVRRFVRRFFCCGAAT